MKNIFKNKSRSLKIDDLQIWNFKNLDQPPLVALKYTSIEYEHEFKHTCITAHLSNLANILTSSQKMFTNEKYILDKIIYKNLNTLRKEKSIQHMRKLKRLLNNFLSLKLTNLLDTMQILNKSVGVNVCAPSREMFEFLLTRLFSSYQLLLLSMNVIRQDIFTSVIKSTSNAAFLANNILFLSTISRMYVIVKRYLQQVGQFFSNLRLHLHRFKSTNVKWSSGFNLDQFPTCLGDGHESTENQKKLIADLKSMELNDSFPLNFMNEQDVGECLDRSAFEEIREDIRKEKPGKLEKLLFKKIMYFAKAYESKMLKKKLRVFLRKKAKKKKYLKFLKKLIAKKYKFEQDLNDNVFKDLHMKPKAKRSVSKIVLNQINSILQ